MRPFTSFWPLKLEPVIWHTPFVSKRSPKARSTSTKKPGEVVKEAAQGKGESEEPEVAPVPKKNPAAVALGRLGGLKGGPARAKKLSGKERKDIARKAARTRWKKESKE